MSFFKTKKFQVIALSGGQGMNSLISLAVAMVMARTLSKVDVAAYQQTLLAFTTLAPFLALGLGQGIYFFLPVEEQRPRGRVFDALFLLGVMGLLFALFILLGGNHLLAQNFSNPRVAELLLWMIPYGLVMVPANLHSAVLVAQKKPVLSSVVTLAIGLLVGLGTIIPLLLTKSVEQTLYARVISSCVTGICAIVLMLRSTPIGEGGKLVDFSEVKRMLWFSFPIGIAAMIASFNVQLDKIIIASLSSPEEFAVYQFGAREFPFLGMIAGAITAVMIPDLRKAVVAKDFEKAASLFKTCAVKSSYLIFPLIFGIIIFDKQLAILLYGAEYAEAATPMRIYALPLFIRIVVFGAALTALGLSKAVLARSLIAITCNVLISIPAVIYFGPQGAAWSTVFVVMVITVPISIVLLKKNLGCQLSDLLPIKYIAPLFVVAFIMVTIK